MSEDGGPPAKRTKLLKDDYEKLTREELIQRLYDQEAYIDTLQTKPNDGEQGTDEQPSCRDPEDRLKQQQVEATRRENVLVMRLTTKEQEMQEYLNQIQELKQVRNPGTTQLRGMLLDPAINLMFQRMKREMDSCKEKLEQAQNDLAAWKFTPDSQTGKRLMAKCRMLLQENEELGKMISAGRTAKLEGEIALEKKFVEEMKKSQAETDEFLVEMDEDMEGMQSTIYILQQQLKDTKDELARVQQENSQLHQQQQQSDTLSAFPKQITEGGGTRDGRANALTHSQHAHTDVKTEADRDSYKDHCDNVEGVRTSSVTASSAAYTSLIPTGNNIIKRTNTDDQAEAERSVTSSSAHAAEHRTVQPPPGGPGSSPEAYSHHSHPQQPQPTQAFNRDDGLFKSTATNGGHVAMETDLSEEPQSSCEDETQHEQNNCHSPRGGATVTEHRPLTPRPVSPLTSSAPNSNVYNHTTYRASQSSDGALTYEGTDTSNEPWSPLNQSKTSCTVSDDEQNKGSCGDQYRTDSKGCPDRLQNGLIVGAQQYDTPEQEMIE